MGGGAVPVMRNTAKVGLGAIGSYRVIPFPSSSSVPLAERVVSARNSAIPSAPLLPASVVANQHHQKVFRNTMSTVSISSSSTTSSSSVQRPSWEINDWEFIGEDDHLMDIYDPPPTPSRLVYGSVPSLEEAKSATSDLNDALNKIYFTSGAATHDGHGSTTDMNGGTLTFSSKPNHALQAFSLLHDSPEVQNVVASLASDRNVWEAVMKNEEVMEFYGKANKNVSVSTPGVGVERKPEDGNSFGSTANGFSSLIEMVQQRVLAIVSRLSEFLQSIFRNPAEGNGSGNYIWKWTSMGAHLMSLTIAAIMVVMVKRA